MSSVLFIFMFSSDSGKHMDVSIYLSVNIFIRLFLICPTNAMSISLIM